MKARIMLIRLMGDVVRRKRVERGLRNPELCRMADLPLTLLASLQGGRTLSVTTLLKLELALGERLWPFDPETPEIVSEEVLADAIRQAASRLPRLPTAESLVSEAVAHSGLPYDRLRDLGCERAAEARARLAERVRATPWVSLNQVSALLRIGPNDF